MSMKVIVLFISLRHLFAYQPGFGLHQSKQCRNLYKRQSRVQLTTTFASDNLVTLANRAESDDDKSKKKILLGWDRLKKIADDAEKDPQRKGLPPIYEPGPYTNQVLAALAYVVPMVDAAELGKYMFEAYPKVSDIYFAVLGPLSAVFNGVPFFPFAVFFLMSYICRADNFTVEIRFHVAQALMLSIFQFVPSLLFGFMAKAGVPYMGVLYNTGTALHAVCPQQ